MSSIQKTESSQEMKKIIFYPFGLNEVELILSKRMDHLIPKENKKKYFFLCKDLVISYFVHGKQKLKQEEEKEGEEEEEEGEDDTATQRKKRRKIFRKIKIIFRLFTISYRHKPMSVSKNSNLFNILTQLIYDHMKMAMKIKDGNLSRIQFGWLSSYSKLAKTIKKRDPLKKNIVEYKIKHDGRLVEIHSSFVPLLKIMESFRIGEKKKNEFLEKHSAAISEVFKSLKDEYTTFLENTKKNKTKKIKDFKYYLPCSVVRIPRHIIKDMNRTACDYVRKKIEKKVFCIPSSHSVTHLLSSDNELVDKWIEEKVFSLNKDDKTNFIVGVDCEWDSVNSKGVNLVQISTKNCTLLLSIDYEKKIFVPKSIVTLFQSKEYYKVFFNFKEDLKKLRKWTNEFIFLYQSMKDIVEFFDTGNVTMGEVCKMMDVGFFFKDRVTRLSRWSRSPKEFSQKQRDYAALDSYFCKCAGDYFFTNKNDVFIKEVIGYKTKMKSNEEIKLKIQKQKERERVEDEIKKRDLFISKFSLPKEKVVLLKSMLKLHKNVKECVEILEKNNWILSKTIRYIYKDFLPS